jgi:hypothetical protein
MESARLAGLFRPPSVAPSFNHEPPLQETPTRPTKLAGVSNDGAKSENADIAALSDVASGVLDDEAKPEIAENGKRREPNAERFPVSTDQARTLSG